VVWEPGSPAELAAELEARGHRFKRSNDGDCGGYQAILRDPVTGV